MELKNTIFKQNSGTDVTVSGIVTAQHTTANLVINGAYIHDCSVNSVGDGGKGFGGFLDICSGGTVTMTSGTVENITTVGKAGISRGGFAHLDPAGANSLYITGGTFSNLSAANGGMVYLESGTTASISNATISNCTATGYYGGAFYNHGGTLTFSNTQISGCSAHSNGGTGFIDAGTTSINGCNITGTNLAVGTAGTLNIDNTQFSYTGTNNALSVSGSKGSQAGVINISNGSVIKSNGYDIDAYYGKVTCNDSDFIGAGTWCVRVQEGGILSFSNSRGVNTNNGSTSSVFYSNTVKAGSSDSRELANLIVYSGYYSGNYIAARDGSTSGSYLCRIFLYDGCFSRTKNVTNTAAYNGTSTTTIPWVTLTTARTQVIDGTTYTFPYMVGDSQPQDGDSSFNNPGEINF